MIYFFIKQKGGKNYEIISLPFLLAFLTNYSFFVESSRMTEKRDLQNLILLSLC